MGLIQFDNICKSYGQTNILRGVSLDIRQGEFVTLLGPSGCGKSTLLRILAGLEIQDSGHVRIAERIADDLRPKHRDVAMVFQSYALYPHMTVAANMAVPLRMRRLSFVQRLPAIGRFLPGTGAILAEIEQEVASTARALGIEHLLARKPGQLSGGQRQRVAVGRAMVRRPAVFLMDEPLSNLDAALRVQLRAEIKDLHRRLGATFLYVTHDQAEAMTMSDRVAVMRDGVVLQFAPPQEIYASPADRRVAEFVGAPAMNILPATVRDRTTIDICGTAIPMISGQPPGTSIALGVRPEAVALHPAGTASTLPGTIMLVEDMGSDFFVHLRITGECNLVARVHPAGNAHHLREGMTIAASFPFHCLLFAQDGQRLPDPPIEHCVGRAAE